MNEQDGSRSAHPAGSNRGETLTSLAWRRAGETQSPALQPAPFERAPELRQLIVEKTAECLAHLGLKPHDLEIECLFDADSTHAFVLVDVRPQFATLWRYGPHVEAFVKARLARKYALHIARLRLHWSAESAFEEQPVFRNSEGLYRALRNLGPDQAAAQTPAPDEPENERATSLPGEERTHPPLSPRQTLYISQQRAFRVHGEPDTQHGFSDTVPGTTQAPTRSPVSEFERILRAFNPDHPLRRRG